MADLLIATLAAAHQAKATGLRNLPCHRADANTAWLEIILAATDLVTWSKLIGFTGHPDLATCEIDTFRYRVLHVAVRITAAPAKPDSASTPPDDGPPRSSKHGNDFWKPSPNVTPSARPTRGNPRPWNARTPSDTGRPVIPIRHNQPHKLTDTSFTHTDQTARKIEARGKPGSPARSQRTQPGHQERVLAFMCLKKRSG